MRLSDAIALGRTLIHPLPGIILDSGGLNGCALGMGYKANGAAVKVHPLELGVNLTQPIIIWPWLESSRRLPCRCVLFSELNAAQIIAHLFDYHVMGSREGLCRGEEVEVRPWTLDQLIDWVRSVEPEEILEAAHTEVANGDRAEVNT